MQLWLSTIIQMWAITTVIWLDKEVNCVAVSDHTDLVPFGTWTRFQACWAAPQRPLGTSRRAEPDAQAYPAPSLVWRCYSWSSSPDHLSPHCTLHTSSYWRSPGFMRTTTVDCCCLELHGKEQLQYNFPCSKKHADQQAGFRGALATSLAGQDGRPAGTTS